MRLNELIRSFTIYASNEEKELLWKLDKPAPLDSFKEREQVIIDSLVRKSLVSKLVNNGYIFVIKND